MPKNISTATTDQPKTVLISLDRCIQDGSFLLPFAALGMVLLKHHRDFAAGFFLIL
jgi:hypothetical protein